MKHQPDDFARTEMPEQIPRSLKRDAGRTPTRMTPVIVRSHGVDIEQHHRDYVCERLGHKLGKFALSIERVYVRFDDLNGPKGGVDHECRIQVTTSGLGDVIVGERSADAIAAFDLAAERIMVAVEHRLGRVRDGHVREQRRSEERRRARA